MIRMAMVGVGHWGPNLLRNLHENNDSRVDWVVDSNPQRLELVKSRFPDVQVIDNLDVILHENVDAVVIATPATTHYGLARRALQAGKHVMVEKPITNNISEAEELCAIAESSGLILFVGHVFMYNPAVRKVKQYLDNGDLGNLYYMSMVRTNLGPIRHDTNASWDLAAHDISIANYWLGGDPISASATGGNWINEGLHDAVFASLKYPNKVLVNINVSWLNPRKSREITVVGEKRMLTLDDLNLMEPLRIYDKQVAEPIEFVDTHATFRSSICEGDITIPKVTLGEPLRAECDHFVQCVVNRQTPLTDGRFGLSVVRALDAIDRSLESSGSEQELFR